MQSSEPVFIPSPPPPPRDCIAVDGRKYCRDEDITAKEGAYIVLSIVFLLLWIVGVLAILERWSGWHALAAVIVPLLLLAMVLLVQGGP